MWVDQWDIPAGVNWDKAIDKAIGRLDHFLIVLSPAAVNSKEVLAELRLALDLDKHIIPVIHQSCIIPRQLRILQYIDFTQGDYNAALRDLLEALKGSQHEL